MKAVFVQSTKILAACLLLLVLVKIIGTAGILCYIISLLIFSSMVSLNIMRRVTLAKEISALAYKSNLLKGRTFIYLLVIIFIFSIAPFILVRLYLFTFSEWVAVFLVLLMLPAIGLLSNYISSRLYKDIYSSNVRSRMMYWLASIFMAIAFPLISSAFGDDSINDSAIKAMGDNNIASLIAYWLNEYDNILAALSALNLPYEDVIFAILPFFGNGLLFYILLNFFGCSLLKAGEIRSVFAPLYRNEVSKKDKFLYSFIITLFLIFIYPPMIAGVSQMIIINEARVEQIKKIGKIPIELIDGIAYKIGTYNQIILEKERVRGRSYEELDNAIDARFDEMVSNVDGYLDWYYSIPAEYERLWQLITGNFEEQIKDKFIEKLSITDNMTALTDALDNLSELSDNIAMILAENKVDKDDDGYYDIILDTKVSDIYNSNEIENTLSLKTRLVTTTAVGALAGAVAAKIAAKAGFKMAAKAAAKMAAKKSLGVAIGAGAGLISSALVTPMGGVAVGAATAIAIDGSMLSLEEMFNRSVYKAEIVSAINAERTAAKDTLNKAFEN